MKLSIRMKIERMNSFYLWIFEFDQRFESILKQWQRNNPGFEFSVTYRKEILVRGKYEGYPYIIGKGANSFLILGWAIQR